MQRFAILVFRLLEKFGLVLEKFGLAKPRRGAKQPRVSKSQTDDIYPFF